MSEFHLEVMGRLTTAKTLEDFTVQFLYCMELVWNFCMYFHVYIYVTKQQLYHP